MFTPSIGMNPGAIVRDGRTGKTWIVTGTVRGPKMARSKSSKPLTTLTLELDTKALNKRLDVIEARVDALMGKWERMLDMEYEVTAAATRGMSRAAKTR